MTIREKSKNELQSQLEGFLDSEFIGKISEPNKKNILYLLQEKILNIHNLEEVKKYLYGILSQSDIESLYRDYTKYNSTIDRLFNYTKDNLIDNSEILNGYIQKGHIIKHNIRLLYSIGINSINDLNRLKNVVLYGNPDNLKVLIRNGITSIENLEKLSDFDNLGTNEGRLKGVQGSVIYGAKPENLELIIKYYNKSPNDDIIENLQNLSYFLFYANSNVLKCITENYDNITPKNFNNLLFYFHYSQIESINFILENYGKIDLDTLLLLGLKDLKLFNHIFKIYGKVNFDTLFDLTKVNNEILNYIIEKYGIIEKEKMVKFKGNINIKTLKYIAERYKDVDVDTLCEFADIPHPKTIEIFLNYYNDKKISINELIKYKQIFMTNEQNLQAIFQHFSPIELCDLKLLEPLCQFKGIIPNELRFKEQNHKDYLPLFNNIISMKYANDKKAKLMERIVTFSIYDAEKYLQIFQAFDGSISTDVQRIKNELFDEIFELEEPEDIIKKINDIFERENLPLTGKIFKVFRKLYPEEKIRKKLNPDSGVGTLGSPILNEHKREKRSVDYLIFKDLINISIKSGDRSLKEYVKKLIGSEELLNRFEEIINSEGFDPNNKLCLENIITEKDQEKLLYLFRKFVVLYNVYYGKWIEEGKSIEEIKLGNSTVSDNELVKLYYDIKKGFHLRKGESIYDRLEKRCLAGLGYDSFEDVLKTMVNQKRQAHEKGLNLFNKSTGGKIDFPKNAFLKGISESAFSKAINRGITCREYLGGGEDGGSASSDLTPFDIDGWYTDHFIPERYGNINLVIDTNNGNYYNTYENGTKGYTQDKYELFYTGEVGKKHYGIRTGIPMTEVDYIIYSGDFEKKEFNNICYEIAKNGYYIPITDKNGYIKFTPEMYHQIRKSFNYMEYYDGFDVRDLNGTYIGIESDNTVHRESDESELGQLVSENSPTQEKYKKFAEVNKQLAESTIAWIMQIVEEECGIKFNAESDCSISGAELRDTGSTGRGTDVPTKDVDLDFILLLDPKDYERIEEIKSIIHEKIGTKINADHQEPERRNQLKSQINNIGKSVERPDGIPLDLLILKKSQVINYSSADAMKEKLDFIESNPETGIQDGNWVKTNVIIMKKLLKAMGCYKHKQGGIGGIGVENWIIQNHGNFIEALESFENIAFNGEYQEGMTPIVFEEFQKRYPMYDAGDNYKDGGNDNFVYTLKENGYKGIIEIIKTYRLKGIKGIRKILKEYEN